MRVLGFSSKRQCISWQIKHKFHTLFEQESMSSLSSHQVALECIQTLGEEILSFCHPDSVITIKSWISVTKTRYEEVSDYNNIHISRLLVELLGICVCEYIYVSGPDLGTTAS